MGNALIDRLASVFGLPAHVENPTAYAKEIGEQIAHFSPEAINRAAVALIRNGGKSWPSPKAIVDACVEAQEAVGATTKGVVLPAQEWPWERDAKRANEWAKQYCQQTGIGLRAFTEGWGRQLLQWAKSYAREHFRRDSTPSLDARPNQDEVKYWKGHCRCSPHSIGQEREWLLGPVAEPQPEETPEW